MKLLAILPVLLLVSITQSAPASEKEGIVELNKDFFAEELAVYTAEHDIINVLTPLNSINLKNGETTLKDILYEPENKFYIFFTQADIKNGVKDYKGVFLYHEGKAVEVLKNGRDSAAAIDDSSIVYIGASDGLYIYDGKTNKVEKWGTITDSIVNLAKINGSDGLYILTENHEVYKVTDNGTKKTKLNDIINAEQIVLDNENVLYFVNEEKQVFAVTDNGVKQITDLPKYSSITLVKPPILLEEGIPAFLDTKVYQVHSTGVAEFSEIELLAKPTGYSPEATIIQIYGYDKKLYIYNFPQIIAAGALLAIVKGLKELDSFIVSLLSE